jgi:hypothetical protein
MNILQAAIDSLWYWTYGIIAAWGASFSIAVALILFLFIRYYQLQKRIVMIENRLVCSEREHSFHMRKHHE